MHNPSFKFESSTIDLSKLEVLKKPASIRNIIKSFKEDKELNINLADISVTNNETGEVSTLAQMDRIFNN